jgi:hypothetical protein
MTFFYLLSLSRGVIIIVSEAGDRTKKQLKFPELSLSDSSCVLTMKIGSLNLASSYLSSTCCKIGFALLLLMLLLLPFEAISEPKTANLVFHVHVRFFLFVAISLIPSSTRRQKSF